MYAVFDPSCHGTSSKVKSASLSPPAHPPSRRFYRPAHPRSPTLTLASPSHSLALGERPFRRWPVASSPARVPCQTHSAPRPSWYDSTRRGLAGPPMATAALYIGRPSRLGAGLSFGGTLHPHNRSDRCCPLIHQPSSRLDIHLLVPQHLRSHDGSTSHYGTAARLKPKLRATREGLVENVTELGIEGST